MHAILGLWLLAQIPNLPALNGSVTGVLRTTSGSPAAGVRVTAVVPPTSVIDEFKATAMASIGETDSEGRYHLESIPPGRYYISAGRIDFPTYYPGATTLSEGTLLSVTAGVTTAGVDFVLKSESSGRATPLFFAGLPGFNIPVNIRVEGGGKIPVFQNGNYPVIRAKDVSSNDVVEILFSDLTLSLPLLRGTKTDEYNVTVEDLDGYTVKAITFGSTDLKKETLKIPRQSANLQQPSSSQQAIAAALGLQIAASAGSSTPLTVVLSRVAAPPATNGVRVTGRSNALGQEIYLSGIPGTLYSDGTFEFSGVLPGLHKLMKTVGTTVTVAAVLVGNRDVDDVTLQRPQLLPIDMFAEPLQPPNGNIPESRALALVTFEGRVLDETSQETISQGTVTLTGYQNTRRIFAIVGEGFRIPELLPGTYSLTLNLAGYTSPTRNVTLGIEDLKLDVTAQKEPQ